MDLFNSKDFKTFDIAGFEERMRAIRGRIRPKLTSIGEELAGGVSSLVDQPVLPPRGPARAANCHPPRRHLGGARRGQTRLQEGCSF